MDPMLLAFVEAAGKSAGQAALIVQGLKLILGATIGFEIPAKGKLLLGAMFGVLLALANGSINPADYGAIYTGFGIILALALPLGLHRMTKALATRRNENRNGRGDS